MITSFRLKSSGVGSRPSQLSNPPILLIPSFHLVHHRQREGEYGLRYCQRIRRYCVSASDLVRYIVQPKCLQDVLSCFLGFVIQSTAGPRSAVITSIVPFRARHVLAFVGSGSLLCDPPNHWRWIHQPKHGYVSSLRLRWAPYGWRFASQSMPLALLQEA